MFDPYHKWLGIPPHEQPPDHYRLLGINAFESDPDVIDAAANRQMAYLQRCATGTQTLLSQRLLNEVAVARLCLLTPGKKATYDARLKAKRAVGKEAHSPADLVPEQTRATEVRRRSSDKKYPVLEGLDTEAKPYEVSTPTAIPTRTRSPARKRFRLPVVASIIITLAGVLFVQKVFFASRPTLVEARKVEPGGYEGRTATDNAVGAGIPKEDNSRPNSSNWKGDRPVEDIAKKNNGPPDG